ncbi:MAG: hypothetical protein J6R89_06500, partial [Clostridia bacterium]|nr:hypothetical protein [Clostridia bacterium]
MFRIQNLLLCATKFVKEQGKLYNYSNDLDEVINYNFNKVKQSILNREFPFSHEVVDKLYKKYLS